MALDPYSPCPGGTGKKIKFCCTEFIPELDKLQRMVEGDQRAAALELVGTLLAKYPDRACLLATKFSLEADAGQETMFATAAHFQEKHPDNPVALAALAVSTAGQDAPGAVRLLQEAILKAGDQLPLQVYDALSVVGVALFGTEAFAAARAHWMLQFSFSGGKDEQVLRLIMQLQGSPEISLLWKDDLHLSEAPADALWRGGFVAALSKARSGHWLAAADALKELADKAGYWPPIARNLAILRTWLGDHAAAVKAWRELAGGEVPLDDAVEAEAMAQLLDPESAELTELLKVVYPVTETENLLAQLTTNRQSLAIPGDLRSLAGENQPPPKGYFSLLDRSQPESAKDLQVEAIPRIIGQMLVFGRQTDREARAELITTEKNMAAARAALETIARGAVGSAGQAEVVSQTRGVDDALALDWYLPADIAPTERRSLLQAGHRQRLLIEWPDRKLRLLGGRTPREAAQDAKSQIPVLAAILNLELASDLMVGFDFNQLRRALGLPESPKLDPAAGSILTLPLVRLARLDTAKLGDEDLLIAYERASQARFMHAIMLLGREIVGRKSLDAELDKGAVYAMLAQLASDPQQASADLDAGRKIAESAGKSTARFDLIELAIHMGQGDIRQADRLLKHIRTDHLQEPGIAQALYSLLAQWGVIRPDGSPATERGGEPAGLVVPGAEAEPAGKIWTPGSDTPTGGGKKSAIWTPGLD